MKRRDDGRRRAGLRYLPAYDDEPRRAKGWLDEWYAGGAHGLGEDRSSRPTLCWPSCRTCPPGRPGRSEAGCRALSVGGSLPGVR